MFIALKLEKNLIQKNIIIKKIRCKLNVGDVKKMNLTHIGESVSERSMGGFISYRMPIKFVFARVWIGLWAAIFFAFSSGFLFHNDPCFGQHQLIAVHSSALEKIFQVQCSVFAISRAHTKSTVFDANHVCVLALKIEYAFIFSNLKWN